jgi:hypothetical protein
MDEIRQHRIRLLSGNMPPMTNDEENDEDDEDDGDDQ